MLAACAALALTAFGCGEDDGADDPLFATIERANEADDEFGLRFTVRGRFTDGGESFRVRGYGQIEAGEQRSRSVIVGPNGQRIETFTDEPYEFARIDPSISKSLENALLSETEWIKVDQDKVAEAGGFAELQRLQSPTPAEALELLKQFQPKIEDAGPERIGGVPTRRYRVTTTVGKVAEVLSERGAQLPGCVDALADAPLKYVFWIDDKDLVRRFRLRLELAEQEATVVTVNSTGFDRALRVDVPKGRTVYDATREFAKLARASRDRPDDCLPAGGDTKLISAPSR